MTLERRVHAGLVELRAGPGEVRTVGGYGAMFNQEAVIAGLFREIIAPGAFRSVGEDGADIVSLFNHDENYVLGRTTAGTLTVIEDKTGLRYEATPPLSRADVIESLQRRDVTGSSFSFKVAAGGDTWTPAKRAGELPLRTITCCEVRDVGPVTFPAYDVTTAEARSEAETLMYAAGLRAADDAKHKTASGHEGKWYAGTDGKSFPISTAKDVSNAAKALGRTNQDKAKVKANIIRIAYAHGLESGLPDAWKKAKDQKNSARLTAEQRAMAIGMADGAAEEEAELITYAAMRGILDQAGPLLAQLTETVDALIADETDDPTETPEEEAAEEEIEAARFAVIQAVVQQLSGVIYAVSGLAYQCMRRQEEDDAETDVQIDVSVLRAELDLLEVS